MTIPSWLRCGICTRRLLRNFGAVPTMIERDDNIPALSELVAELAVARDLAARHTRQAA